MKNLKNQLNTKAPESENDDIFDEKLYTIEWSDIDNSEIDYENYLNDIENFFREDFDTELEEIY